MEWRRRGKPADRLYRGTQLIEARAWAERNFPSAHEMAFLQAGSVQGRTTRQVYFVLGTLIVILALLVILLLLFLSGNVPKFV